MLVANRKDATLSLGKQQESGLATGMTVFGRIQEKSGCASLAQPPLGVVNHFFLPHCLLGDAATEIPQLRPFFFVQGGTQILFMFCGDAG